MQGKKEMNQEQVADHLKKVFDTRVTEKRDVANPSKEGWKAVADEVAKNGYKP